MLRVTCEKCKTPSQVDERQVPRGGLTMRCPKCGHSYLVERPKGPIPMQRRVGSSTLIFGTAEDLALTQSMRKTPALPVVAIPPTPPAAPAKPSIEAFEPVHVQDEPELEIVEEPAEEEEVGSFDRGWFDEPVTSNLDKGDASVEGKADETLRLAPIVEVKAEVLAAVEKPVEAPKRASVVPRPTSSVPRLSEPPKAPSAPRVPQASRPPSIAPRIGSAPRLSEPPRRSSIPPRPASVPRLPQPPKLPSIVPRPVSSEPELTVLPSEPPRPLSEPPRRLSEPPRRLSEQPPRPLSDPPKILEIAEAQSGPVVREVPFESFDAELVEELAEPDERATEPPVVASKAPEPVEKIEEAEPVARTDDVAPMPVEVPAYGLEAPSSEVLPPKPVPPPEPIPKVEPVREPPPADDIASLRVPIIPAQVETPAAGEELPASPKRSKVARWLVVAAVLAGAALEMTPYGAFARVFLGDKLRADEYAHLATSASDKARAKMLADVFPDTVSAREELARLVADAPRANDLVAYRALFDADAQLRFGPAEPVDVDKARALIARMPSPLSSSEEAFFLRGEIALASQMAPAAMEAFEKARAKRPSARAYFGLARAHLLAGDVAASRKDIEATIAASPRHAGARVLRAGIAWLDERDEGAMEDLSAVFDGPAKDAASPRELARAWALAGLIEVHWGRNGEAHTAFEQALKLDPRNVEAFVGQGELAFADAHISEALARFEQALTIAPSFPDAVTADAQAKLSSDRAADAHTLLAKARKEHPKDFRIAYWLAKSDEALGNDEAAEKEYAEAEGLADGAKDAFLPYAGLVQFLVVKGRAEDAQAKLEEAKGKLTDTAPLERALGEGYRQRGLQARKRGAMAEAIADLGRAAEIDPARPDIYADLADCYEAKNDSQSAFLSWQKALKGNDTQIYWRYRFGRLLLERGTVSEAAKHLVFAVDAAKWTNPLPPWFGAAELACAQALQKAGRFPEAIAHYKDYLARAPKTAPERRDVLTELAKLGAPVKEAP